MYHEDISKSLKKNDELRSRHYDTQIKTLLVMSASNLGAPIWFPAALILIQLSTKSSGKAENMVQEPGSLPLMQEKQMEFMGPGFSLAWCQQLWPFREWTNIEDFSLLSFSLCHSAFQVNIINFKYNKCLFLMNLLRYTSFSAINVELYAYRKSTKTGSTKQCRRAVQNINSPELLLLTRLTHSQISWLWCFSRSEKEQSSSPRFSSNIFWKRWNRHWQRVLRTLNFIGCDALGQSELERVGACRWSQCGETC